MARKIPKYIQEYHAAGGASNREAVERFMKTQVEYQRRAAKGWQTRRYNIRENIATEQARKEVAPYIEAEQQTIESAQAGLAEIANEVDFKFRNFYDECLNRLPEHVIPMLTKYFDGDLSHKLSVIRRIELNRVEIEAAIQRYEYYKNLENLQLCLVKIATILHGGTISEEDNIALTQIAEEYSFEYMYEGEAYGYDWN